jgi:hypothetical protein
MNNCLVDDRRIKARAHPTARARHPVGGPLLPARPLRRWPARA